MMSRASIIVRVDGNAQCGFGHLSRCVNLCKNAILAGEYNPKDFLFAGCYGDFAKSLLTTHKFKFIDTPDIEQEARDCHIPSSKAKTVILDSYFLTQDLLNTYSNTYNNTIIIDDTCELNYQSIDLAINLRVNAESLFSYNAKNTALGLDYFLTKPELHGIRTKNLSRIDLPVNKVLLFMGGGFDDCGKTIQIISHIQASAPTASVYCVTSQTKKLSPLENVTFLQPRPDIESLLDDCDVCINGGGLIKYEVAYCCIPTASFSTTKLQDEDSQLLSEAGVIMNLGLNESTDDLYLANKIDAILNTSSIRQNLIDSCRQQFSSGSVARIIKKIESVV